MLPLSRSQLAAALAPGAVPLQGLGAVCVTLQASSRAPVTRSSAPAQPHAQHSGGAERLRSQGDVRAGPYRPLLEEDPRKLKVYSFRHLQYQNTLCSPASLSWRRTAGGTAACSSMRSSCSQGPGSSWAAPTGEAPSKPSCQAMCKA